MSNYSDHLFLSVVYTTQIIRKETIHQTITALHHIVDAMTHLEDVGQLQRFLSMSEFRLYTGYRHSTQLVGLYFY